MKKAISLFLAFSVVVSVFLAGCGGDSGSNGAGAQTTAEATNTGKPVKLLLWRAGNDQTGREFDQKLIDGYKKIKPNVEIEYSEAPFGNEFETKLNMAFASNSAPDLIEHFIASLAERASKGQYLAIDDYLNNWDEKSDIIESNIDAGTFDGKVYGIGYYPAPALYVYRKDYFKEAGLDPENPPKTWNDLAEAAVKLTKRNGDEVTRAGLAFTIDNYKWLVPFARANGAQLTKDGQPSFDAPEFAAALSYFTDLMRNKKVNIERTEKQEWAQPIYTLGQAAIAIMHPDQLNAMIKNDPSMKDKTGFLFPEKDGKSNMWVGNGFMFINANSNAKDESWDFVKYTLSKDNVWDGYKSAGHPVVRKSLVDQYVSDDPWLNDPVINASKVGTGAEKVTYFSLIQNKYLVQAEQEAYFGKKAPEQALKDAVDQLKKELAVAK